MAWWRKHVHFSSHRRHWTASCKCCDWHGTSDDAVKLGELVIVHLYRQHLLLPPMPKK